MAEPARPIFYSFRRCPYAMRARLALDASGLKTELREIVLRDKPEAFLAASPSATVPTLVLNDGTVIDESIDIMRWALAQNDPHGWLGEGGLALQSDQLIDQADGDFKHHLDRTKYASRYADSAVDHRAEASLFLMKLEMLLIEHKYLLGSQPALADMAIAPFVRQFANIDRDWFDDQSWPNLSRWLDTIIASPAFIRIMAKYPAWKPGDVPVHFPAET